MNNLGLKFNIYDQIGYLLVGAIGLLVIYFNSILLDIPYSSKFNLSTIIIWTIIAYFLGHLVQAISNIFVKEKKEDFSDDEKRILNIARSFFDAENLSDNEIWNLCYMLGVAKDPMGQIQIFNAYYSLYRGWFVVFIVETLFLLGYVIFSFSLKNLILPVFSGFIAFLFLLRMRRFYHYLKKKVFQIFIIIKKIEFKEVSNHA